MTNPVARSKIGYLPASKPELEIASNPISLWGPFPCVAGDRKYYAYKSEASQKLDTTSLKDSGLLRLGQDAAAGQYALQITVKDQPAGEKPRIVTHWSDFEIVR